MNLREVDFVNDLDRLRLVAEKLGREAPIHVLDALLDAVEGGYEEELGQLCSAYEELRRAGLGPHAVAVLRALHAAEARAADERPTRPDTPPPAAPGK
jgi:hypothetical protein